jgi:hypothetical protein
VKYKNHILFFILITVLPLSAQIKFYTTSTMHVGPGIIHKKIIAPTVPWTLNVLEIDLKNEYVSIESLKANNLLASRETTTSMAERNNSDGHWIVGAINGDFYDGSGIPIGSQILNGQILKRPIARSVIGFNNENFPMANVVSYSGTLFTNDLSATIQGINQSRQTNQLVLYNRFFGSSTETNEWGTEVRISPLTEWSVNDTVLCLIDTVVANVGNLGISSGMAVLSGHGTSETFLTNNIQTGDSIKIFISLAPGLQKLKQLVGGFPKIVKDGQNYAIEGYYEEGGASTFHTARHPRTAAGFSADSSKLYFITVDGRQSISAGINLIELADFMIDLGIENGINLDGGGSTTMVVHGQIENSPSESERAVSNALAVVSSAPKVTLSSIQIDPDYHRVFIGKSMRFKTTGWDTFYNPIEINMENLQYMVSDNLGSIDNSGQFTAANAVDSGYVMVHYGSLSDSAYVSLKTAKHIEISPKRAMTDTVETIQFRMSAIDEDNLKAPIRATDYIWECLNPEVGIIDSTGLFKGKNEGTTKVVARFGLLSDTATVNVEIIEGTSVIDSMDAKNNWTISGILYDTLATTISIVDTPRTIGTGALRLDYQFVRSSKGRTYIHLDTDIHIFGIPDSIFFDIKSDGQEHRIFVLVSDENDELFRGSTGQFADLATSYDTLRVATDKLSAVDPSSSFHYPIRFRTIETRMGYYTSVGDTNRGTLYFDNLRLVYPDLTSSIPLIKDQIPGKAKLYQNYPNPFNSSTTIEFEIAESGKAVLTVYDITGREVAKLLNRKVARGCHKILWDTKSLASGLYFYRLETKSQTATQKMMLLK